ncbi:MAG: hypothetical protein HUJ65_01665, partial [Oscillospiraceae bacterium]|nr:hypothetical protein [Oscillospiraceae bacterium]
MNGNQDYFEIDLLKLGLAILKKWWLIVLSSVLGVVLAVAITAGFMTPMYSSEILMYVNNGSVNIGS